MAESPQVDMPRTQGGAPPSFYNSVASMPGQQSSQGQPGQQGGGGGDSDKFIEMTTKLLTVLSSMQAMKPNGMDVTKYTQAAADAMKSCLKNVLGTSGDQAAGTTGDASTTGSGAQSPQTSIAGDTTGGAGGGAVGGTTAS